MSELIKGFITPEQCETLIAETKRFYQQFYTDENLAAHRTYISDTTPHRTSHAYAISSGYVEGFTGPLPTINLASLHDQFPAISFLSHDVLDNRFGLNHESRALFNVQEYFGGSEPVPQHNDGELLEFTTNDGGLQIKRSIRPEFVAVLTLVNDTDEGGTRVHYPDGSSRVIRGEAGDLLIFNNVQLKHSVDALKGNVKRADGILRQTIGWRSLSDKCFYSDQNGVRQISSGEADKITETWYQTEWPKIWQGLQESARKAAF
jgi:hypothetical protein